MTRRSLASLLVDSGDDVVDMLTTPGAGVKLTVAGIVSTFGLEGGASVSVYKLCSAKGSAVGGTSAIRNMAGSGVLTRPRLLISILPVVVVFAAAAGAAAADSDDDGDDARDDVTVTSRSMFVVFPCFRDALEALVPL